MAKKREVIALMTGLIYGRKEAKTVEEAWVKDEENPEDVPLWDWVQSWEIGQEGDEDEPA